MEDGEFQFKGKVKRKASMSKKALDKLKLASWQHHLQLQHRNRYSNLQCGVHFLITVFILVGGAFIFHLIEADAEKDAAIAYHKQASFVQDYLDDSATAFTTFEAASGTSSSGFKSDFIFTVTNCNANKDSTKLSDGVQQCPADATGAKYVGVIPSYLKTQLEGLSSGDISGSDVKAMSWEITSSIFFMMTIISTIGYGTFAPATDGGKAFIAIFCFIGIGYFGYTLTLVSDRILVYIQRVAKAYYTKKMNQEEKHYWFLPKWKQLIIISSVCIVYIFFLSMFGPIVMSWTFLQSVYFATITFSTIGFGDYAPTFKPEREGWFKASGFFAFALLTLLGLALLSGLLGGYSEYMEELDFKAMRRAKRRKAMKRKTGMRTVDKKGGKHSKVVPQGNIDVEAVNL